MATAKVRTTVNKKQTVTKKANGDSQRANDREQKAKSYKEQNNKGKPMAIDYEQNAKNKLP